MSLADKDVVQFADFTGLRNTVEPENMETGDLVTATNVDVTDAKRLRRRKGFDAPVVSGACHSFWSSGDIALVARGAELLLVNPNFTTITLRSDLTLDSPISFSRVGDRVFFSNGYENGVIESGAARSWGLPVPALPAVAKITGALRPGKYQYVTTVRGALGQESGAGLAGLIELTEPGGLAFSGFGAFSPGLSINLYLTQPDGDQLYLAEELSTGATAAVVTTPRDGTTLLVTQFLSPPPTGSHIGYAYGRMYVAHGNRTYYSEPYAPELFDLRKQYQSESLVTMVAPIDGGLFIGSETDVGWVGGTDPEKGEFVSRVPYGVIPGTLAYGSPDDTSGSPGGSVVYFATTGGIMRGTPGGVLENLTRDRYEYPTAARGAGVVRTIGGVAQYLTVLQG